MKTKLIIPVIALILIVANVLAVGVSTLYWGERTLNLNKGESATVQFLLQNMVGEDDVSMLAEIVQGKEVAQIMGPSNVYRVPAHTKDIPVNLLVKIPREGAKSKYTIAVLFKTVPSSEQGVLQFATGLEKRFDVIVTDEQPIGTTAQVIESPKQEIVEQETQQDQRAIIYGIIAVIIILVIWILHQKAKYKQLKRSKGHRIHH